MMSNRTCLAVLALGAALLFAGCEREKHSPAGDGTPERSAEDGRPGTVRSAPPTDGTSAVRAVVLHVSGMMKSKSGAT